MRHLIVGAGPAALHALETIRSLDPAAQIDLVCDEPAYSRMVLPYFLIGNIEEPAVMTGDPAWFDRLGVRTHFGRRVVGVEADRDRVRLDDSTTLEFDRLLLATGSRPTRPAVPGVDGPGVLTMWTLDDARSFLAQPRAEAVIVGAGFIAFTILDAVVARAGRVHLVEIEPRILPRMLDGEAGELLQTHLAERGVQVHTGVRLERIETVGSRHRLALANGEALECDATILATGIRPNLDFVEGSGIETDQGILVDGHLRTSRAHVYAAGDVAQGPILHEAGRRVQAIQPTAVDHGRVAGANMAGLEVAYSGSLTMNILAAQGLEACSFGSWDGRDDVTTVRNPANRIYRKYVWRGDRLVGGILVGPSVAGSGVNDLGMLKGLIQTGVGLGRWKDYLVENPLDLRRPFVASGAARALIDSTLLAGRLVTAVGYRFPSLPPLRQRTEHHRTFLTGVSGG